jgi:cytochrome c oxidase cbb3-type subunit III
MKGVLVINFFRCLIVICAVVAVASTAFAQETVPPKMTYMMFCATCHGESGKGNGPSGASLSTKPRNFTDCKLMAAISDQTIFKVIKYGGAAAGLSREMPGWAASLDDNDIHGLVKHIRGFCKQ